MDTTTGPVSVVITTPTGTAASTVTLAPFGPSFLMLPDGRHVNAIVVTAGPGNSGSGYDIIGPSRPIVPGETLILFGVGFGPTDPTVAVGKVFSGAAPVLPGNPVQFTIGGIAVPQDNVKFVGVVGAGLYQINVVVQAGLGSGEKPLIATVGGLQTQTGILSVSDPK